MPLCLAVRASNGVQGSHSMRTADLVFDGHISGDRILHKPVYSGKEWRIITKSPSQGAERAENQWNVLHNGVERTEQNQ